MDRHTKDSTNTSTSSRRGRSQRYGGPLTDQELNELFPRKLESVNPQKSTNCVHFDYHLKEYVPNPAPSPVINLLHLKSSVILKTSPEALESDDIEELSELSSSNGVDATRAVYINARPQKKNKTDNAFNRYQEATQTTTPFLRTTESQTVPTSSDDFSFSISSSIIFDSYAHDFSKQSKENKLASATKVKGKTNKEELVNLKSSLKIMERVICENIFRKVYLDFRYNEDFAGNLLALWSFSQPKRKLPVTDIEWSHEYYDLFAVTFGDRKNADEGGTVAIYSIKNCLYPEFLVETTSPALCVSLNSKYTSLLAVGFLDGNISVFDCLVPKGEPIYKSGLEHEHKSSINAIRWMDEETKLYSISSDGCVKQWEIIPTALSAHTNFIIEMPPALQPLQPAGIKLNIKCAGLRFTFHPVEKNIYLLGTTDGFVMKCSTLRLHEPLFIYHGHQLTVHRISYNPYFPAVFISCSADSTIKIWEDKRSEPLLTFDLGCGVIDSKWSPYTSTVFSAVTRDGSVHFYDLNINYNQALHKEKIVSTAEGNEPTQLTFNKKHPIMLITDTNANITAFKLSPNLRIQAKPSKKDTMEPRDLEIRKLQKFLAKMKPKLLKPPVDVPAL